MQPFVTTRLSLLLRIRDTRDAESWREFVRIYAPLIFRYAKRMGLQDADAADVTQDVLKVVSESIERFNYDPSVGRFRGWLKTVAFYTYSQMKKRNRRQPACTGDSTVLSVAEDGASAADSRFWNDEYTRRMFELASERVQPTVQPSTWEAFMATAVHEENPRTVADRLGMNVGSVYVAKNRVFTRIREALSELDEH